MRPELDQWGGHHRRLAEQDMAKTDMKGASVFQGKADGRSPSGNRKQVFLHNFIDSVLYPLLLFTSFPIGC